MDWPEVDDHFLITSLNDHANLTSGGISSVSMLGVKEPLEWKLASAGLWIRRPNVRPCDGACVFQIELQGIMVEGLAAERLDDEQIRLEMRDRNLEDRPVRQEVVILDNGRAVGSEVLSLKPGESGSQKLLLKVHKKDAVEKITATVPRGKPFSAWDELVSPPALPGRHRFDGNTRLAVSDLGKHQRLTVSFWARADALKQPFSALLNTNGWAPGGIHVQFAEGTFLEVAMHGPKNSASCRASLEPAKAAGWRMITVTYGAPAGQCKVYINGKYAAEVASEAFPVDLNAFALGGWDREPRPLVGQMADVRIYGRVLSTEEIDGLLRGQASAESLLAAWDFAKTDGNMVPDISGHGRDARVTQKE